MRYLKQISTGTLGLLVGLTFGQAQSVTDSSAVQMEAFTVAGTKISATEVEGPQGLDTYDPAFIEGSGAFSVNEFIGSLPETEEGTTTLVLIDGRPTYLDPGSLPIGMIAGIEVSRDGSMPQYGEYHNGRIINIRLKPDYTRVEVGAKYEGAWAGGGSGRTVRLAGATNRDKLRAIYSVEFTQDQALRATDRDFSQNQDHRYLGGRDLRLAWGQTAVVVARDGTLDGVTDAEGNSVRTALVPTSWTGDALTAADFLPPDPLVGDQPDGQRRFDTAAYRWLASPSEKRTANLGVTYNASDTLRLAVNASHQDSRGESLGPPPVTPASARTIVPAAYNPFSQDVAIGMVHEAFGPTRRNQTSVRDQIGFNVSGELPGDWKWSSSTGFRRNTSERWGDELDPAKFATALAHSDPAQRFNPFLGPNDAAANLLLKPVLFSPRISDNTSEKWEAELEVEGTAFTLPGGPAELDLEANFDGDRRERRFTRTLGAPTEDETFTQTSREWSTSLRLPWVGKANGRTGLRRMETHLNGEYQTSSDDSDELEWELGWVWAPFRSLMFRARLKQEVQTPPREGFAGSDILIGDILIDPLRDRETLDGVRVFTRETVVATDEKEQQFSFGAVYEPPAIPGLEVRVSYRERAESGVFEDDFDAQDILTNEVAFAERVQRTAPTASDLAAGRPGRVLAIDLTPGSTGEAERREMEFEVSYRPPEMPSGRWRVSAEVDRTLSTRYEILPGLPYVFEGTGSYRRPRWRSDVRVMWSRDDWNASARLNYSSALSADSGAFNSIGALTTLNLNVGRRWKLSGGRNEGPGRDLKMVIGIDNLFDRDPPWADTISGYRGGSPLGRTYSGSLTLEF